MYKQNSKYVTCEICNSLLLLQNFQLHLKTDHNITFLEYIGKINNKTNSLAKDITCQNDQKKYKKRKKIK